MEKKKTVTITVDTAKWERFKKVTRENNRTASLIIRDEIDRYLKEHDKEKKDD
jgi:predicted DNA-binding protein